MLDCMIVLFTYKKIHLKMKGLEFSQHFSRYNPMDAICCHGNKSSDLAETLTQPFPYPNDTPDDIWF